MAMNTIEKLPRDNVQDIVELAPMQEGLLFHCLKDPENTQYHVQLCLELAGSVDRQLLQRAWEQVVQANEMLRTVFRWQSLKRPVQIVLKKHAVSISYSDLSPLALQEQEARLEAMKLADQARPFHLQEVPLRIALCKLSSQRFVMMISNHHIIYDGWSNGIILKELFGFYQALQENRHLSVTRKTPFKAYIQWLQRQDQKKEQLFWQEYLKDFQGQMHLPIKSKQIPSTRTAACHRVVCPPEIQHQLELFCRQHQVTRAAVLYSAIGIVLQKYQNMDDIVFGTTVSGRTGDIADILTMIGLFINTVPLRFRGAQQQTLLEVIQSVNVDLLARMGFENSSLVTIKSAGGLETGRELFDINVVVESYPLDSRLLEQHASFAIKDFSIDEMAGYDLTIVIGLLFDSLEFAFKYVKECFAAEAMVRLADCLLHTLTTIVNHPSCCLGDIEIVSASEKEQCLRRFNASAVDYPSEKTLQVLFKEQVARYPDHLAVCSHDGSLSYKQLYERSSRLAAHLRTLGVGAETVVGIYAERSFSLVVSILAVWQAGGAYLPLDPQLPVERLRYMVEDSGATIVLSQANLMGDTALRSEVTVLDLEDPHLYALLPASDVVAGHAHDLAYIIYTSGSTGRPKGVAVEQQSVVNRLCWEQRRYPLNERDVVLQKTNCMFDFSVWELFGWLLGGASLCLLRPGDEADPRAICETIAAFQVTTVHFVPSMFQEFLDYIQYHNIYAHLGTLRRISTGGEALRAKQVEQFFALMPAQNQVQLVNMYGPTETTIDVSSYICSKEDAHSENIPIGQPIDNLRLYVLNQNRTLQPPGVPGELYIAGAGVSRGYINDAELTARKFVQDPFYPTERMYASGDLARWTSAGEVEYLGRLDYQVKIRGFRVELAEVETYLHLFPAIKEAVAAVVKDASGDDRLCVYVVLQQEEELNTRGIKEFLATKLPPFMIPDTFLQLERLPLTSTGKVDRKKLSQVAISDKKTAAAVPQTQLSAIEQTVAGVWAEVLGVETVGLDEVFFEAGGNSLKVIRVCGRLMKALQIDLPVTVLFRFPTVRLLARYIAEEVVSQATSGPEKAASSGAEQQSQVVSAAPDEAPRMIRERDVAVIGMAGRFPGASSVDEFWENLKQGVESVRELTDEELLSSGVQPEIFNHPRYVRAKAVLEGVEYFDARFFGYSPREALAMDPQMRQLHECVWEALENAGYNSETYGGRIGLFAGASPNFHWLQKIVQGPTSQLDDFFLMLLNEKDFLSARIAYKMNFRGPGVTVQTACTTSLTAIHSAYHELLKGHCDMTVAAAASVTYPLRAGHFYEEGMIYSPDGHCRAFDEQARGTVSGNGVGVVVLKRLQDALRDGDTIHAVIKGSAISNDGFTKVGFTAPGMEGQVQAIREALATAEVEAESISYVEAHGTATVLGDPIEVEALKLAFQTNSRGTCGLGSVKTNIGALGVAGGIAGFIKTVLSLKHAQLPASLHFERPNPNIDLEHSPFYVVTSLSPWLRGKTPLRASVNAFGMGGSNAHIIVEESPVVMPTRQPAGWQILPLSARSAAALQAVMARLHSHLRLHPEAEIADVAYTLQVGRKPFSYRHYILCSTIDQAIQALEDSLAVPALYRSQLAVEDDTLYRLQKLGELWLSGGVVEWEMVHAGQKRQRVPLPTYPFEHQRYWPDDQQADREHSSSVQQQHVPVNGGQALLEPPGQDLEFELSQIWKHQLGYSSVELHDNFFDLGASSLGLLQVNNLIKERLKIEMPLVTLYEHPTIAALAQFIRSIQEGEAGSVALLEKDELEKSKGLLKSASARLKKK